ncbi:MAG TPA: hypothetical protein VLE95_07425 [Chlamydiales bacterium]|nr:hypothetical protein [Chlamydiales bacterium]
MISRIGFRNNEIDNCFDTLMYRFFPQNDSKKKIYVRIHEQHVNPTSEQSRQKRIDPPHNQLMYNARFFPPNRRLDAIETRLKMHEIGFLAITTIGMGYVVHKNWNAIEPVLKRAVESVKATFNTIRG